MLQYLNKISDAHIVDIGRSKPILDAWSGVESLMQPNTGIDSYRTPSQGVDQPRSATGMIDAFLRAISRPADAICFTCEAERWLTSKRFSEYADA
jgi:hypothetical protein